jgi:hypothetical protein
VYTRNLENLLRLLQASRQSGLLLVESAESNGALWQGQLIIADGVVRACQVVRKPDRQLLYANEEALRWLIAQEKLNWNLEKDVQLPTTLSPQLQQPGKPAEERKSDTGPQSGYLRTGRERAGWIPRRTAKGMQFSGKSLASVEHLQVFTLVNGQNTIEGISRLLRKPPETIFRILNDLRDADFIE